MEWPLELLLMMLWLLFFFSVESPHNSLKLKSWFDQQNLKSINQEQIDLGSFGLFLFPSRFGFPVIFVIPLKETDDPTVILRSERRQSDSKDVAKRFVHHGSQAPNL